MNNPEASPGDNEEVVYQVSSSLRDGRPTEDQTRHTDARSDAGSSSTDGAGGGLSQGDQHDGEDSLHLEEDFGSEEDSDMERDVTSSQSPRASSDAMDEPSGSTPRRNSQPRRGGRRRRGRCSVEEMIRRQETASQLHNENERFRRRELRSALLDLRKQLTRPTKRPAVKLVLEASIQELEELESRKREDTKQIEALRDREKRLTFELESKLKEYKLCQDGPPPPTPNPNIVPSSPAFPTMPQVPPTGNWFPIFNPSQGVSSINSTPTAPQVNPTVSPLFFNPWPLARLPSQQLPTPTLNFGIPTIISPSLAQTPAGMQRLNLQPSLLPTLYPFQTITPPMAPHPSIFPTHGGLPVIPRQIPSSETSPLTQTMSPHPVLTVLSPARPPVSLQTPQHSHSETDSGETLTSNRERASRSERGKGRSSKNGRESAETSSRPSVVVQHTTPADSETTPGGGLPELKRARKTLSKTPVVLEMLEKPILSLGENLQPPNPTSATSNRPLRTERGIPPLLKITDRYTDNDSEALTTKVAKTISPSLSNSEVIAVEWCDNPYYRVSAPNRRNSSKRKRRRQNSATDTDSGSASEEDALSCTLQALNETTPCFHSKHISCPGT